MDNSVSLSQILAWRQYLRSLPRRTRRALQRICKQSLAGVALLFALGHAPAEAATIVVNASCRLVNAIRAANTDTATGGCPRGNGADTIVLPPNSTQTLTTVNNTTYNGPTGLPIISSKITIEGNNSTIRRASNAPDFRILEVGSGGNLTLKETTVSGGVAGRELFSNPGGGVFNRGILIITDSTLSGNSASDGGGVFNWGILIITDSTLSGNSANLEGGGGGVWNYGSLTLARTVVSGNTAPTSPEIYFSGAITANAFNLFGRDGEDGVFGFSPGPTDVVPTVPLTAILNPTLARNGSPMLTHALVPGSPALDAIPLANPSCTGTDQRGVARPQGSHCDIGAVEAQGFCIGQMATRVGGKQRGRSSLFFFRFRPASLPQRVL